MASTLSDSRPGGAGITAANRTRLDLLHRTLPRPFTVAEAAQVLGVPTPEAQRFARYLVARGWLSRVRRGLYIVVPLGATEPASWREDPWVAANSVYAPCFLGGWSACEHWSLSEQLFRAVQVHTARKVRGVEVELQGTPLRLHHVPLEQHFGLRVVWRGQTKLQVSDPTRTVIDILSSPSLGGGIRNVAEVLRSYLASEHAQEQLLVDYAGRLGNRTVFKRLGYLLEQLQVQRPSLIEACAQRISAGLGSLDPSVPPVGTVSKRWQLRINVALQSGSSP